MYNRQTAPSPFPVCTHVDTWGISSQLCSQIVVQMAQRNEMMSKAEDIADQVSSSITPNYALFYVVRLAVILDREVPL